MKLGDKYRCFMGRGILEVVEIIDSDQFVLKGKEKEYIHHIRDINKTIFEYRESKIVSVQNKPYFLYDEKRQNEKRKLLYLKAEQNLVDTEIEKLKSLHRNLNEVAANLSDVISKLPGLYTKGARTNEEVNSLMDDKESKMWKMKDLDVISSIEENPYLCKLDVYSDYISDEEFYIGKREHRYNNMNVYAWQSQVGKLYYLKDQRNFHIKGIEYKVKNRIDFDITNCIINNLSIINYYKQNEKEHSNVVYDSFLIEIIKNQRINESIKEIISSIQEKQYRIISEVQSSNMLIQGCAGSGKTMILLHRISYLLYNKFLNPSEILILTPNDRLSTFIRPIMSELDLENVEVKTLYGIMGEIYKQYTGSNRGFTQNSNYNLEIQRLLINEFDHYIVAEISKYLDKEIDIDLTNLLKNFTDVPNINNTSLKSKQLLFTDLCESIIRKDSIIFSETIKVLENETIEVNRSINDKENSINILKVEIQKNNDFILKYTNELNEKSMESKKGFLNRIRKVISAPDAEIVKITQLINNLKDELSTIETKLENLNYELKGIYNRKDLLINLRTKIENRDLTFEEQKSVIFEISKTTRKKSDKSDFILNHEILIYFNKKISKLQRFFDPDAAIKYFINKIGIKELDQAMYDKLLLIFWIKYSGAKTNYKLIVIDEAQDYSLIDFEILKLTNNKNIVFNFYGDMNQSLYSSSFDWSQLVEKNRVIKFELNENYRNSYEITSFYSKKLNMRDLPIGIHENSVKEFKKLKEAIDEFVEKENGKIIIVKNAVKVSALKQLLSARQIKINNEILTIKEVKGMEFKSSLVFIDGMSKNELYIAYTRARTNLLICDEILS